MPPPDLHPLRPYGCEMDRSEYLNHSGPFEARYLAFLETIAEIRPRLHRFCARMTGSIMDGEDVVQEALFEAYRNLDRFDASRPLKPWLFQIAHNRCIDLLRKRGVRDHAETAAMVAETVEPQIPPVLGLERAVEHLVANLAPKERACVLLKDVFDHSLQEVAEMVGSSVGGVKAALNRGRTKLASTPSRTRILIDTDPHLAKVMKLYVDRFNRRDWDGVRDLTSTDARLVVADAFAGKLADAPYFANYHRRDSWRLAAGHVDGEPAVILLRRGPDTWAASSIARLRLVGQQIDRIDDYTHCPWVPSLADSITW
jgi:RNA polymerase sigma-70 factor, ECF subfamily